MAENSNISWTNATWNPVTGCTRSSAGCDRCYAVTMSHRLDSMGQAKYAGLTVLNPKGERHFNGTVRIHYDTLEIPIRWKKPRHIFVNSMSDLFHGGLYGQAHNDGRWIEGGYNGEGFQFLVEVWNVMRKCPQHTFQILTKRPRIMADLVWRAMGKLNIKEPLPNVWLGASVEEQETADKRIPHLLNVSAVVRFLSCEPLLGPIDLSGWLWGRNKPCEKCPKDADCDCGYQPRKTIDGEPAIHLAIVGCESGSKAREMKPEWARDLAKQCLQAETCFFMKQLRVNGRVTGELCEFPKDLQIRQFPKKQTNTPYDVRRSLDFS